MEPIKVKINGREFEADPGKTILDVVRENEIDDIPTLCYSPELDPYGSCFLCVVEVEGRSNLVPSCSTRLTPGMEVQTRSERVIASRKTALELLLSNHYADCLAPCALGCPAGVDAQGYIALSAMGLHREAVELIREKNPLPAVCGRICVRKCELLCRRNDVDEPVGINAIKRFITDLPGIYDDEPECAPPREKSVGIVGAGPAGLTAAWFLGRNGYKTVIYEAMDKAGGMLRYGIPAYRLTDAVLDREVDYICKADVEIRYGVKVGRDIPLQTLRANHDAVFLAAGAWAGKAMMVEGEFETDGVVGGIEFLRENTDDPQPLTGTITVIGGGNTAVDAARTAWRLGADKVIVLYRRTKNEMPADEMEIAACLEEGIEIMELAAPVGIIAEGSRLTALRCTRMKLGSPDSSGRRRPIALEGSEFDLPCRTAVVAIGQAPALDGLTTTAAGELGLSRWNTIEVDSETMNTNIDGLFAGGDAADDGPTVVIDAIRDGRKAAGAIHAWLGDESLQPGSFAVAKDFWVKPGATELGEIKESPRHEVHTISVEDREGSFAEVASGFEYEDNVHETARCLSCGCVKYEDCPLRIYAEEYQVDMDRHKGHVRKHKVDDRHPYLLYDPNKCILCARCIRTCARVLPIPALGLIGRGIKTEMRPAMNDPLAETSCISCGNCIDACPTGALTSKYAFPGRAFLSTNDVDTYCGFCSLGCPITVKRFGDNRYHISSGGGPGAYLCRYGRFDTELFIKQKRIVNPVVRSGSEYREVGFEEAYGTIVDAMKEAAETHGAESVAVFASPELTNEELYLAGRIAREGLKTNNIGSFSILSSGREPGILDPFFGFTASTADRTALADADLIVCSNTSLESDHLILSVEVNAAVRTGTKLIVANSTLTANDRFFASLAMDPMRGSSSVLWNGVLQMLLDSDRFKGVEGIPGAPEFLGNRDFTPGRVSELTGVSVENIGQAARLLGEARRVVFIHSPDRAQDQAPGDMETLANFVVILRAFGLRVDLLLPEMLSNSAAMDVMGADPGYLPGRTASPSDLSGARDHEQLIGLLEDGKIRAALIIGEDPLRHERTASYFQNIEFLAAMDWTSTETTRYAHVVLPGSTFLETDGTRCNFEGKVLEYARAVEPPSGISGTEALVGLARHFGIKTGHGSASELSGEIGRIVRRELGDLVRYYWNTGQQRVWGRDGRLVPADPHLRAGTMPLAMTHFERHKEEIRNVGAGRFKVQY